MRMCERETDRHTIRKSKRDCFHGNKKIINKNFLVGIFP